VIGEERNRVAQEPGAGVLVLPTRAGVDDLDVGQPGVVVDRDMDVVVAHPDSAAGGT
jgi:hypothetical protein